MNQNDQMSLIEMCLMVPDKKVETDSGTDKL